MRGGVTVSDFDWMLDQNGFFWTDMEVNQYLEKTMVKVFHEVYEKAKMYKVHLRTGAYCMAVEREWRKPREFAGYSRKQ